MNDHKKQVFQAYAKTVQPTTSRTNDAETAFFLAVRRLGKFAFLAVCLFALAMIAGGCNSDSPAGTQSPIVAASVAAPPTPHVAVNVMPGTKFRHHTIDADVTFVGQDQSGAVTMDIRVDGSQQLRAIMDPTAFLSTIATNHDWKPVDPKNTADLSVQ
jgi:hypothetical protein